MASIKQLQFILNQVYRLLNKRAETYDDYVAALRISGCCSLASHFEYVRINDKKDRQKNGQTLDHCITLSAMDAASICLCQ